MRADRGANSGAFERNSIFNAPISKSDSAVNYGYNLSEQQTRHILDHLITQRYHYLRKLGSYHAKKAKGDHYETSEMPLDPLIPYEDLLGRLFPEYKFVDNNEDTPTNLFVRLPNGIIIPFDDLSSGEREVFLILSSFLRYGVTDSIIILDEPELHLHPELSRILVKSIKTVMPNNQIWLASHNGEIIDEAGRDKVIYISKGNAGNTSVVVHGSDETEAAKHLKNMFGYSGYIGVSKHMVFLEGKYSSTDRKVFSSLFPDQSNTIKFIPANSSEDLPKINSAIMSILESNIGDMQFYMIRDRDYLPDSVVNTLEIKAKGRMHVLSRCHIENYLIIPELISKIQTEIYEKPISTIEVLEKLKFIAFSIAGEVLRDMISFRLNLIYKPQDFSLEGFLKGQRAIDKQGDWITGTTETLFERISTKAKKVNSELTKSTEESQLRAVFDECSNLIKSSLDSLDNKWLSIFPGKRLLNEYRSQEALGKAPAFENLIIKEIANHKQYLDRELVDLVNLIERSQLIGRDLPIS